MLKDFRTYIAAGIIAVTSGIGIAYTNVGKTIKENVPSISLPTIITGPAAGTDEWFKAKEANYKKLLGNIKDSRYQLANRPLEWIDQQNLRFQINTDVKLCKEIVVAYNEQGKAKNLAALDEAACER